jgi:DNA polymerase-3 subunit chi
MPETDTADRERVAEFIALQTPEEKLHLVCQWSLRCYRQGHTVSVRVAGDRDARRLDKLLWTFADMTFLPHAIAHNATEPVLAPVLIYCEDEEPEEADVLFEAVSGKPLASFERFPHIYDFAEVYDEELRNLSRERFSTYKDAGYRMRYVERS